MSSPKPRLVSYDLDGTLADDTHRVQDALDGNWEAYFDPARVLADPPLWTGVNLARADAREGNAHVAYLTGRWDGALRPVTLEWMWRLRLPYGPLRMRLPEEQSVSVPQFKLQHLLGQLEQFDSITHYDDDPVCVATINDAGDDRLSAVQVTWYMKAQGLVGDHMVRNAK